MSRACLNSQKEIERRAQAEREKWKPALASGNLRLVLRALISELELDQIAADKFREVRRVTESSVETPGKVCDTIEKQLTCLSTMLQVQRDAENEKEEEKLLKKFITPHPFTCVNNGGDDLSVIPRIHMNLVAAIVGALGSQLFYDCFFASLTCAAVGFTASHILNYRKDASSSAIDVVVSDRDIEAAKKVEKWKKYGLLHQKLRLRLRALVEVLTFRHLKDQLQLAQKVLYLQREADLGAQANDSSVIEEEEKDLEVWISQVKEQRREMLNRGGPVQSAADRQFERTSSLLVAALVATLAAQFFAAPLVVTLTFAALSSALLHLGYEGGNIPYLTVS